VVTRTCAGRQILVDIPGRAVLPTEGPGPSPGRPGPFSGQEWTVAPAGRPLSSWHLENRGAGTDEHTQLSIPCEVCATTSGAVTREAHVTATLIILGLTRGRLRGRANTRTIGLHGKRTAGGQARLPIGAGGIWAPQRPVSS